MFLLAQDWAQSFLTFQKCTRVTASLYLKPFTSFWDSAILRLLCNANCYLLHVLMRVIRKMLVMMILYATPSLSSFVLTAQMKHWRPRTWCNKSYRNGCLSFSHYTPQLTFLIEHYVSGFVCWKMHDNCIAA